VCTSTLSRVASLRDLSHFVGELYDETSPFSRTARN
jgi:hypothetical protein